MYFNAGGLANEERLNEFELALSKVKWDIVGMSEARMGSQSSLA